MFIVFGIYSLHCFGIVHVLKIFFDSILSIKIFIHFTSCNSLWFSDAGLVTCQFAMLKSWRYLIAKLDTHSTQPQAKLYRFDSGWVEGLLNDQPAYWMAGQQNSCLLSTYLQIDLILSLRMNLWLLKTLAVQGAKLKGRRNYPWNWQKMS